jgi:hypothetical protein
MPEAVAEMLNSMTNFAHNHAILPMKSFQEAVIAGADLCVRPDLNFPVWMIHSLDKEARRIGVARQALIKVLIAQHLERTPSYSRSAHDADEKR